LGYLGASVAGNTTHWEFPLILRASVWSAEVAPAVRTDARKS
jgi:hypothetical protein